MYAVIEELAPNFSARAIAEELERRFERDWYPSRRTIQDVIREVAPPVDVGEPWSVATADPDEAALVLPVLADLIRGSMGRLNGFGVPIAARVAHIRRAADGIPPTDALRMAARYVRAEEAGASTEHLDAYLALEAWDDKKRSEALDRGWLPPDWWVIREARNG